MFDWLKDNMCSVQWYSYITEGWENLSYWDFFYWDSRPLISPSDFKRIKKKTFEICVALMPLALKGAPVTPYS